MGLAAIDVPSMADLDHEDNQPVFLDLIQYAIVSDADAVARRLADKLLRAGRERISGQGANAG